ncbi:LPP20 family lipoprotein [bacterium]|nr:LPP20 family lipoprotein [bacterium]MBU1991298.1 LPP20 family lipoprotein [bacterium]
MQNNTMRLKSLLTVALLGLVFSGCGSSPTPPVVQKPKELPAWVMAPVKDDASYMYGVAIESDRDASIKAALSDMVAKLGTTLESSYESNQEVQGSYNKSTIKNQIKSEISKIKINNYEVVKSERISYREFAVMIKSDKQKFVQGLIELLDTKKKSIELKMDALKNKDALTKYNEKKELSSQAGTLLPNVLIIGGLRSSIPPETRFEKEEYLSFISEMEKEFGKEQKSLTFYISGDSNSLDFVNNIKNYLANQGFTVVNTKKENSVLVQLGTTDNINTSSSIKIAVLKLNIEVFSNSQRIGGKAIILKERFNGSESSVYKNASIHLEQDIKSKGINEIIGINLNI